MSQARDIHGTKQRIVDGAVRVFASRGYHQANVEDILVSAGVSRATFYAHFENKDDLFSFLVDHLLQEESAYILKLQQEFIAPSGNVRGLIGMIFKKLVQESRMNSDTMRMFFDIIPGSGTRAGERFVQMQKVTLNHFYQAMSKQLQSHGYSPAASIALPYLLIGGLAHIGRLILDGDLAEPATEQIIKGMSELMRDKGK